VILFRMDKLEVAGGDEEYDRAIEALARGDGPQWLSLAESGTLDGTDYVAHVLDHLGEGGYPGAPFYQDLLRAIASADKDNRDAVSLGHPELVGLYRAATEITGGVARLLAVLDRR
jgi:hypothetical protein